MKLNFSRDEIAEILQTHIEDKLFGTAQEELFPYGVTAELSRLSKDGASVEVTAREGSDPAPKRVSQKRVKREPTVAEVKAAEELETVPDAAPWKADYVSS